MAKSDGSFKDRLKSLREEYGRLLPTKIDDLVRIWNQVRKAEGDTTPHLAEAYRQAHSLAGSGATFGYSEVSEVASELEQLIKRLEEGEPFDEENEQAYERYLVRLRKAAREGGTEVVTEDELPEAMAKPSRRQQTIYWLGMDRRLSEEARTNLPLFGFQILCLSDLESLQQAVARQAPDLLVFDLAPPEGIFPHLGDVFALMGQLQRTKTVCIMPPETDQAGRLEVIRAGAECCMTKPISFDELLTQLDRLAPAHREQPYRLLIVDDDEILAKNTATIMERAGMKTAVATDPFHALEVLPAFDPDLILMDLHMPQCSGTELARLIRQNPQNEDLPIVYLSKEAELNKQLEALEAGAEDFLIKPVKYRFLYHALACRIRRTRSRRDSRIRDGLTGLLNHTAFQVEVTRRVALGAEKGSRFVLALMDLDNLREINDTHGPATGDRVLITLATMLRRGFGNAAVLSRFLGNTFGVLLPGSDGERARDIFDHLRKDFARVNHRGSSGHLRATISIGLAEFPRFAATSDLIDAAGRALGAAKRAGRNRIETTTERVPATPGGVAMPVAPSAEEEPFFIEEEDDAIEVVDECETADEGSRSIVVVDDDRQVLAVITTYLESHGFRVWGGITGEEGYDLVRKHRPDLVLIDLLLFPGIHGFELCKKIKNDTDLDGIKIILMTAVYKDYRYRVEGREAGGDAFIIKPINFDELMGQIQTLVPSET